eukprot:CAMPEP_0117450500 /NCGR_PEP_ID=MMETSP0759-20121206/8500_1 /TAXON_ID=63605 /ORGANISM="Percolomonas cosmopolitus, Strain WS" /LENGTH=732 /DNA_ID=CAMNT_0005243023 /DNA_START=237 /DNA_END=2435 /DNA_ORIENTATION=-
MENSSQSLHRSNKANKRASAALQPKWLSSYTKKINTSLKMIQKDCSQIHEQIASSRSVFTEGWTDSHESARNEIQSQVSYHLDCIEDHSNILKTTQNSLVTHVSSTLSQIMSLKSRIRSLLEQQKDHDIILMALFEIENDTLSQKISHVSSVTHNGMGKGDTSKEVFLVGSAIASEETEETPLGEYSEEDAYFEQQKKHSRKRKHLLSTESSHQSSVQRRKSERSFLRRFREEYMRLKEEYDVMKTLPDKILKWNNRKHLAGENGAFLPQMDHHMVRSTSSTTPTDVQQPSLATKLSQHSSNIGRRTNSSRTFQSIPEDQHEPPARISCRQLHKNDHSTSTESLKAENKLRDSDRMQLRSLIRTVSSNVAGNNFHNITHIIEDDSPPTGAGRKLKPITWSEEKKDTWDQELDKYHERYIQEQKRLEENAASMKLGPIASANVRQQETEGEDAGGLAPAKLVHQKQMPFPSNATASTSKKQPYRPFIKTFHQSKQLLKMSASFAGSKKRRAKKYAKSGNLTSNASSGDGPPPPDPSISAWVGSSEDPSSALYAQKTMRAYKFPNNKSSIIHKPPNTVVEDPLKNLKEIRRSSSPHKLAKCSSHSSSSTSLSATGTPSTETQPQSNSSTGIASQSASERALTVVTNKKDPYAIIEDLDADTPIKTLPEISKEDIFNTVGKRTASPHRLRQSGLEPEKGKLISESPKGRKREPPVQKLPVIPNVQTLSLNFASFG